MNDLSSTPAENTPAGDNSAVTPANPVSLTAPALSAIREAMEAQKLDKLRIGVVPGGCSGFSYDLELVGDAKPTDLMFEQDGVKIIVDPMSAQYLKGVSIDFVTSLQGSGFKFNNPTARSTCGCGSSFSA
jgi:iron-sulfur cluster assembly accessory protein